MKLFIKNCRIRDLAGDRAEIEVPYDCKKPAPAIVSLEPFKCAESPEKRLLHQIFCIFIIPDIPARQIESRLQVPENESLEILEFFLMVHERPQLGNLCAYLSGT